jgi:prepilin-type N-terminal cleavage/methylation domain-containing protein
MKDRNNFGLRRPGFTLLELVVAFTILAMFVLPILEIIAASRMRAVRYTRERAVRELAQRKLFDRIYYVEQSDTGTFEVEGHPDWTWEVLPPNVVSQGEQVLLEYTIRVTTSQSLAASESGSFSDASSDSSGSSGSGSSARGGSLGSAGGAFEMSTWTFPSQAWLDEQEYLQANGYDSVLNGGGAYGY